MSAERMRELQLQMRQNQMEIGDFLTDLDSWTNDMKKEDDNLKKMKPSEQTATSYPPVRSAAVVSKIKEKRTQKKTSKTGRIKSYDYRTWEKLDCDKMLEDIDKEEEEMDKEVEVELYKLNSERKAKVAAEMKEKGNEHFKNCGYEAAIQCYTTGLEADPSNPVFPANRAMAYLKLKKYVETEADCTLTLSLDPSYTKAYLRRGIARAELGKVSSAKKDFKDALKLEPGNRQAKTELEKLNKMEKRNVNHEANTSLRCEKSKYVQPIYIPPKNRSKKPLMRINVQEIGAEKSQQKDTDLHLDVEEKMEEDVTIGFENDQQTKRPAISILSEKINICEETKSQDVPQTKFNSAYSNNSKDQETTPNINNKHVPLLSSTTSNPNLSNPKPTVTKIPSRPTTSFQFQADVKLLSKNATDLLLYLYQIKPTQISILLKQQMETTTLMPILRAIGSSPDGSELDLEYLHAFANLDRFDMIIMFLSGEETNDIRNLFQNLTRKFPSRDEDIRLLSKKYGL